MSFGYSPFELVKTLDNAAVLIKKLKDSPKELDSIKTRVQFGQSFLASLQEQVVEHAISVSGSERDLLKTICDEYGSALQKLDRFIQKNTSQSLERGKLSARLIWVAAEHFTKEREELSKTLKGVESRINLVLQKLNWGASLKLLRSGSISVSSAEHTSLLSGDGNLEDARSQHKRNDSSQNIPDSAAVTRPAHVEGLGLHPNSPGAPYLSPYQTFDTDHVLNTSFTFEQHRQEQRDSNGASSNPIPFTRSRQPASFSASPKDRTQAPEGSPSTISTVTPSVFSSSISLSSQSDVSTPRHSLTQTLPYQEWNSPTQGCSGFTAPFDHSESTPNLSTRGRVDSRPRQFSSASASLSPGRNAPPRFEQELSRTNGMLQGIVKLWFKTGPERISRNVIRINIEGEHAGFTRRLRLTTDDGKVRVHEANSHPLGITESFLQLHPQCIEHITTKDQAARFVVSFIGAHTLTRQGEPRPFFKGSPEYSFTNEQDCWAFQSSVSCGKLVENIDTERILSAGNTPLSVWQVLQVWIVHVDRRIRFLAHDTDHTAFINNDLARILDLKANTLYPIEIDKTKDSELKLAFKKGSENADLGKLKLTFTKELEKEKTKKSRRKSGSKERPTAPEEESVKQRLIRLAQFGTS